ncbi:ABC transporter permease [Flavobacterium kingsejongi]|uniref:Permease n=1 Tax=Flavobacterium kingsejongi TaxID=1678728 RepID=A0A2S1LNK6_9FLAO|nr:ABC transporter permease [Flavobacterium kingsejongi]AWG25299.1 permease [Flavobacterium kingsejongi]
MIVKIAWKNMVFKPLNTILSIVLLTASVAIISLLILLQEQFENKFSKNIEGVDLVLGAQGSPLQLILSSVYQMDAPTGNINYKEAQIWMRHPYVKKAIPLAFGDNYQGYKILGTTEDYIQKYDGKLESGMTFHDNFDVVLGSAVAEKMKLKPGDEFYSSHGDSKEGEVHKDFAFKVKGVLLPTGKVMDNLILTTIESIWAVHDHHEEEETVNASDEVGNNEQHQEHEHHHEEQMVPEEDREITAVLLQLRNKMAFVLWPRLISQNTKMQAASPAIEINRLFTLFGFGLDALQYLAYGIMLISGISIFIALYNTLKERKYEFALLRVSGASRSQLLKLVLFESILLCVVGFIFGTVLGRIGLWLISSSTEEEYKMSFNPFAFVWEKEGILFLVTIFVGIIAALIPAVKAYQLNISKTLANA